MRFSRPDAILIIIFLILSNEIFSQITQKVPILGVAIQGNKTISENSIKIQSGLLEGQKITYDDIPNAIKQLWKLNLFSNIQIYVDKATSEGLLLIIQVEEYPRLANFKIEGNKKIRKSKFDEELNLISGKVLSPALIAETKRKILKLYESEGYLLAEVNEELTPGKLENTQNLTLKIKEGKKVRIKDIQFNGNKCFSDFRLRRALKDTKRRNLFLLKLGEFKPDKYDEDKLALRDFYNKEGYRDFEIVNDSIAYSADKKHMFINFDIYEGPRYKYRSIEFSGNQLFTTEQLKNVLGIKPGDYYNKEELEKGIYDRVNGVYMDRGYLFFQIIPREIPVSEDEIDLLLNITENSQVSVSSINIAGNTKTHENVIRRELKLFPGDIFSRDALIRSQREIFILNYFGNVTPDVIPINDKEVDIEIAVEEKSSDRANLSFSVSQTYGLVGGGGLEFNNFRGRGQQFTISYQQGTGYSYTSSNVVPYKSISLGFSDPRVCDTPNLIGGGVYYSKTSYSSSYYYYPFDLSRLGGSIRWGRRFKWPDYYFRGSWSLAASKKHYMNVDENYLEDVLLGMDHTTGISLTQVITRDSRDAPEFPTTGSVFQWTSTLSGAFLGGTEHFHKYTFSLDYYMPTIWKLVLFNHVEFGLIKKLRKNSIIPPDERFIMGGAGMIYGVALRGYDDNNVGPIAYSSTYGNYSYGGEAMLKYTLEYRVPISSNPTIYGLVFAEAGNNWKTLKTTDPFDLKRSAGFGIRFYMPAMGMIGVDLGYGFDDIDVEGSAGYGKPERWKTHFIFGMSY
jgi:outer membrane protein insertion porin family